MHELAKKGDYQAAAAVRDQLSASQLDDEVSVLSSNAELYSAFSARDIERIRALWLEAPYVQCIHPYENERPAVGHTEVCQSWKRLFHMTKIQKSVVSAESVRVNVRGATATVTCLERLSIKGLRRSRTLATNIFRKVGGRWFIVHRHVSPVDGVGAFDRLEDMFEDVDDPQGMGPWRIIIKQGRAGIGDHVDDSSEDGDEDDSSDDELGQVIDEEMGQGHPGHGAHMTAMNDDIPGDGEAEEMYIEEDVGVLTAARDTVRALRRLSKEGQLTRQARIQLLSQMIRTPGESMPERAHDLLLSDVSEEEAPAAWEDFADLVVAEASRLDQQPRRLLKKTQQAKDKKGRGSEAAD